MEGFIIEVKINKEIQRYQESILFGLSLRQMVFALLAIGVAVGAYFGLKPLIGAAEDLLDYLEDVEAQQELDEFDDVEEIEASDELHNPQEHLDMEDPQE